MSLNHSDLVKKHFTGVECFCTIRVGLSTSNLLEPSLTKKRRWPHSPLAVHYPGEDPREHLAENPLEYLLEDGWEYLLELRWMLSVCVSCAWRA